MLGKLTKQQFRMMLEMPDAKVLKVPAGMRHYFLPRFKSQMGIEAVFDAVEVELKLWRHRLYPGKVFCFGCYKELNVILVDERCLREDSDDQIR